MIQTILSAILTWFLNGILELAKAYSKQRANENKNSELIENLQNAKTEQEQQNATNDIARDLGE